MGEISVKLQCLNLVVSKNIYTDKGYFKQYNKKSAPCALIYKYIYVKYIHINQVEFYGVLIFSNYIHLR